MARGINKVILIGNLGADPEIRYLPNNGSAVATLRIATSESWRDKQTGELQEKTEWHRVTLFNRLAEIASEYLRKGAKVYIEGRLRTNKWQDSNGQDRYTTEILANELQMLDGRSPGGMSSSKNSADNLMDDFNPVGAMPEFSSQPMNTTDKSKKHLVTESMDVGVDFNDDIPF